MNPAQFLDIRNMDFEVPNALQKRPGSTFALGSSNGTSGPISSLFEFIKLNGESYIVCGSDTAMFYIANNAYTILSPGWTNGQPTDMLTFVNRLWMANGQNWQWFDGSLNFPAGLPIQLHDTIADIGGGGNPRDYVFNPTATDSASGGSYWLVNGATHIDSGTTLIVVRGLYMAYTYLRSGTYESPADFQLTARNLNTVLPGNGVELLTSLNSGTSKFIGGFTVPSGQGINALNIYFAEDTATLTSEAMLISGQGIVPTGNLGWMVANGGLTGAHRMSITLKPDADLSRFYLWTTIPTANLFLTNNTLATYYTFGTFIPQSTFAPLYDSVPPAAYAFSGMPFAFFDTNIPKYIEINQNRMFLSGMSNSPSTVWFSELGEPESYLPESSFEVRTNDGDRVLGIQAYNNQLVVMKENSFHKVIGDSSDNYRLVQVSDQYGCLSQKTIIQYDQKCFWLDKKGILEYNGANHTIVTGSIESIFKRMNLSVAREKAVGVHNIYRNQLWWGIPIDGATQNNLTVVYDYVVNAWTFFDGFNPSSFAMVKGALSKPTTWRGDYSGLVHFTGDSFLSDSGRGITCLALTHFENIGGENQTSLWRRLFLDNQVATGLTGVINCQVFSNYQTSTPNVTFSAYQSTFQTRVEMGVQAKSIALQISHSSASLPLLIDGYGWANRPLRNV